MPTFPYLYSPNFTKNLITSIILHILFLQGIILTFKHKTLPDTSHFVFLGSILHEKDFSTHPSHPVKSLQNFTTSSFKLSNDRKDTKLILKFNRKPKVGLPTQGSMKLFLKSTFDIKLTREPKLKEIPKIPGIDTELPERVPLKLYSDDKN